MSVIKRPRVRGLRRGPLRPAGLPIPGLAVAELDLGGEAWQQRTVQFPPEVEKERFAEPRDDPGDQHFVDVEDRNDRREDDREVAGGFLDDVESPGVSGGGGVTGSSERCDHGGAAASL